MRPKNVNRDPLRAHIAREAARLMVEGGIDDFQLAKRKAAERLRVGTRQALPGNDEVEAALGEYQRLFRADSQPRQLQRLRRSAVQAMRFLQRFEPRLVGPVLSGTADRHSEVCLHLFSEPNEAVGVFLTDNAIPFELGERRLRVTPDAQRAYPTYSFVADDVAMALVVFDVDSQRNPPLSPVDGKPLSRANLETVRALADAAE